MTAIVIDLRTRRPLAPLPPEPDSDWAADAEHVLDAVEALLATGNTTDVIAFCDRAVAYLEANACDIVDPAPLVRLAHRLGDLQRRATQPSAPRRPRRPASRRHPSLA